MSKQSSEMATEVIDTAHLGVSQKLQGYTSNENNVNRIHHLMVY